MKELFDKIILLNNKVLHLLTRNKYQMSIAVNGSRFPETLMYSENAYKDMLENYKYVYLKPIDGCSATGIMHSKKENDLYELHLPRKKWRKRKIVSGLDENKLLKRVRKKIKKPYIIQRGVDAVHYEGTEFFLRHLMQRDKNGELKVTGVGASMDGNLSKNGVPLYIKDALRRLNVDYLKVLNSMRDETIKIVDMVELFSGKKVGIVAIDYVLDKNLEPIPVDVNMFKVWIGHFLYLLDSIIDRKIMDELEETIAEIERCANGYLDYISNERK